MKTIDRVMVYLLACISSTGTVDLQVQLYIADPEFLKRGGATCYLANVLCGILLAHVCCRPSKSEIRLCMYYHQCCLFQTFNVLLLWIILLNCVGETTSE